MFTDVKIRPILEQNINVAIIIIEMIGTNTSGLIVSIWNRTTWPTIEFLFHHFHNAGINYFLAVYNQFHEEEMFSLVWNLKAIRTLLFRLYET